LVRGLFAFEPGDASQSLCGRRTSHSKRAFRRPAPALLGQRMVDYAVAKRRGWDEARLGIAYGEAAVRAWGVRSIAQLALEAAHALHGRLATDFCQPPTMRPISSRRSAAKA
jgi:hypothetical protein